MSANFKNDLMHVAIFVNVREGQLYKPLRVGEGARYKNGFHLDSVLPCFHWNSLWYVVFFSQVCTWLLHTCLDLYENMNISTHTHTHTHMFVFWFTGTLHRRNGFYTVQSVCAIALHLPYT